MRIDKKLILEVCAGSYEDCLAAARGGAKRVELNSALALGGLSPSPAVLRKVRDDTDLEIICMVRPRAGGFCYNAAETEVMFEEARQLLEAGADGLAFGFLKRDGMVDQEKTRRMIDLIHARPGRTAVFHRAIDVTPDVPESAEILADLGCDRILTSGGQKKADNGLATLRELQQDFGDRIEILAGSGVNGSNAVAILAATGLNQLHSSCKGYGNDPTTMGDFVSFAYLPDPHGDAYEIVDWQKVQALREVMEAFQNASVQTD